MIFDFSCFVVVVHDKLPKPEAKKVLHVQGEPSASLVENTPLLVASRKHEIGG